MSTNVRVGMIIISGERYFGVTSQSLKFLERRHVRMSGGGLVRSLRIYVDGRLKLGGGSGQGCGCISAAGIGDLVRIEEIMNSNKYKQSLKYHSILSGRRIIGNNFVFQYQRL